MTTLKEVCERIKLTAEKNKTKLQPWNFRGFQEDSTPWRVHLEYQGRTMSLDFFQGRGFNGEVPEVSRVMDCLLCDYSGADMKYDEFCSEYGYERDRESLSVYRKVLGQSKRLERLLGDDLEEFLEAES
jgi:hypothetical protein